MKRRSGELGKRRKWARGFSLIEIMVVVVIIAVAIGGVLVVGAGSYRRTSVKNAARDIASLMRMASSKALGERIYYNLVLDLDNEDCYLEKHYSGVDGIWEDIPASTDTDETWDNKVEIDTSPGAKKKLARVVDIDNINSDTAGIQKITYTLKETVMGITYATGTWTPHEVYSVFLDDDQSGTGDVQYLVTVEQDTARVKIYSTWPP